MMWLRKLFPLCKEQALIVNQSLSVRKFSTNSPVYSISSIFSSLEKRFDDAKTPAKSSEELYKKSPIIGIDLGASKSRVAVFENGIPKLLENNEIPRKTPSYVTATNKEKPLNSNSNQVNHQPLFINPEYTMFSTKKLLEEWLDQSEYKIYKHQLPFNPVDAVFHNWAVNDKKIDTSEDAVAYILGKLKDHAESYLKTSVHDAVISIPFYSIDNGVIQRNADPVINYCDIAMIDGFVRRAAKRAGFERVETLSEYQASAIGSNWASSNKSFGREMVICNFGGEKFGYINIHCYKKEKPADFSSISIYRNDLGGNDFDYALMNVFKEAFMEWCGVDLSNNIIAMSKLREAAVDAKILLSQATEVEINIPELVVDSAGRYKDFICTLTREEYENLFHGMFEEVISFCQQCVEWTLPDKKFIDEVVFVGGMTKIPKFRKMAEESFEQKPSNRIDPDGAAAIGDVLKCHELYGIY